MKYVHFLNWGVEYVSCPTSTRHPLAEPFMGWGGLRPTGKIKKLTIIGIFFEILNNFATFFVFGRSKFQ